MDSSITEEFKFFSPGQRLDLYASVTLNAAARSATRPLAMTWPAEDLFEDGVPVLVLALELTNVLAGVAVATAFTPPVTGPLSGTLKSRKA
jgi:hypothetical protein